MYLTAITLLIHKYPSLSLFEIYLTNLQIQYSFSFHFLGMDEH